MNENQHDALREYERAVSQVRLKRHELKCARLFAIDKLRALRAAIKRDPDSWNGTPFAKEFYDNIIEGEVIEDDPQTKGQEQKAVEVLAPSAQPGPDISKERSETRPSVERRKRWGWRRI